MTINFVGTKKQTIFVSAKSKLTIVSFGSHLFMGLNNIEITDFIIGEWYKDNLVAQPSAPRTAPLAPSTTPPSLKYLGNNRRNIALLVNSPDTAFLPDNQLAFLTKILEACLMTIADVAIVNQATAAVTVTALRQQLQPKTILLFGLEPTIIRLPINFPAFKLQSYDDCMYLSAPALDLLVPNTEESKLLKSKLWVCLKTLFDV